MRLTAREIELLVDVHDRRRRRKRSAWFGFVFLLGVFAVVNGLDPFPWEFDSSIVGIALGASAASLIHAYLGVSPDDKLVDLLQRYINHDPEAIKQIAARNSNRDL